MNDIIPHDNTLLKRCPFCPEDQQWHPATTEFFYPSKSGEKYGLRSRCKVCMAAYSKQSDVRERNRIHLNAKRSTSEVREKRRAEMKAYHSRPEFKEHSHEYYLENKERIADYTKSYSKDYHKRPEIREKYRAHNHTRRARKRAVLGCYTSEQIQELLKRQKHKCYYCSKKFEHKQGKYIYEIDHTFPISRVAGTDIPANDISYLVLACQSCNRSKKDKFPHEFYEGGKLL